MLLPAKKLVVTGQMSLFALKPIASHIHVYKYMDVWE
jgi:hypothetical protein